MCLCISQTATRDIDSHVADCYRIVFQQRNIRVEQERDHLQQQKDWLEQELHRQMQELMETRKEQVHTKQIINYHKLSSGVVAYIIVTKWHKIEFGVVSCRCELRFHFVLYSVWIQEEMVTLLAKNCGHIREVAFCEREK